MTTRTVPPCRPRGKAEMDTHSQTCLLQVPAHHEDESICIPGCEPPPQLGQATHHPALS